MHPTKLSYYYSLSHTAFSPDFFPSFSKVLFPTEAAQQKFAIIATIPSLICASPIIHEQDLSFKCLDCGRENEFHMICEPCFNYGFHEGHRFIYTMERGGCCDCGDIGAIDEQGFCSLHKGYEEIKKEVKNNIEENFNNINDDCAKSKIEKNENESMEEEKNGRCVSQNKSESLEKKNIKINDIDVGMLHVERFDKSKNILEQSFKTEFFMMFESILIRIFELYEEETLNEQAVNSNILLANLFIFLEDIMNKHGAVGIWFSDFLMGNVADALMNEFHHDCECYNNLTIRSIKTKCHCSYLELLFRFNKLMNAELQKKMELFLYKLFPNKDFKRYLVKTYVKMLNFILYCGQNSDTEERIFHLSELRTIYTQFFSEDLIEILFSFGFPEMNMDRLEILLDAITKENLFKGAYELILSFYNIFFFLNERRPMFERKIMRSNFLEQFIEILARKRKFENNLDQIKNRIHVMAIGNNLIKEFMGILYKENGFIEKISKIIANLLEHTQKTYQDFDARNLMNSEDTDFIYENDLRILSTLLGSLFVVVEDFKEFTFLIEKIIPQNKRISIFILIFKRVYVMKYCRSELRKNKFENNDWFFFYQVISNLESYENVLVQIIFALEGENIIKIAFDDLTKIQLIEKKPLSNDEDKEVEFFFNFILDILTNETSLLIVTNTIAIKQDLSDTRFASMRNLFANFFITEPKIKFQKLNKLINKHVLRTNLGSIISENISFFTKLVPKTKELILKIEYEHIYEPFFWSKIFQLKGDYLEKLQNLTKKGNLDIFLGSEAEYFSPLMKIIIEKLIISKTSELLLKIIFGEITNNQNLLRYALKLLYYMLSVNKSEVNIHFVCEINEYLNKLPEELQKLSDRKENEYFQSSYRKFSNFLKERSYFFKEIYKLSNFNQINEEKSNFDKKNEMKTNILMKFAKSRQNFIKYNIKLDEMEIEEKKEFECCICHVNSADDLKIVCSFLSFDNLYLYYYGRKREGRPKCVINTCGHNFHKECLNKNISNAYVEYKCPTCKYFLNFWAPNFEEYFHYENNFKEGEILSVSQLEEIIKSTSFNFADNKNLSILSKHVKEFISQMLNEIWIIKIPNIYDYPSFSMVMLLDSLSNCSEKVFSYPLENFFQKDFDLSRSLYLLMKLHLFSEDCPIEYKSTLVKETLTMLDKLEQTDLSLSFETFDSDFNELFWRVAALFLDHNDTKCLSTLSFICKLMIAKLIFVISLTLLTEPFESTLQILSLLESNHFRSQVLGYMQPYFNLIFGNLSIVFLDKKPKDLEESKTENFLILFTKYFPWIFALDKGFLDFWGTKWLPAFKSLPKSSFKLLQSELHRNQGRKFEIFEISSNYMEFYTIHSKIKCNLCHYFPKKKNSFLALCLICGEINCSRVCPGSKPLQEKGNLHRHAKKKHAGSTVFVDIADTKILFVCKRSVAIWDFLYFDHLGQNKNSKSLKWNQFFISEENKEKIREVLSKKELKQFMAYFFHKAPENVIPTDRL